MNEGIVNNNSGNQLVNKNSAHTFSLNTRYLFLTLDIDLYINQVIIRWWKRLHFCKVAYFLENR